MPRSPSWPAATRKHSPRGKRFSLRWGIPSASWGPAASARARRAGVDAGRVRQALLGGFAASRVLEVHGERMLQSNYKPGFRGRLYAKDMRIASETLTEFETPAPVSTVVHQLVTALVASGRGDA